MIPVGITREGAFVLEDDDPAKFPLDAAHLPEVVDNGTRVLWPEPGGDRTLRVVHADGTVEGLGEIDVVLPILHGPHGEDGTIQGYFDTLEVPYAGGGVLDSALCMDKHFMKIALEASGIAVAPLRERADGLRGEGASVVFVAADGALAGLVAVADAIKASTPEAIRLLHADGLRIVMASGDGVATANAVARELGIDEVHGEVRPRDKIELVRALQAQGHKVAMAGDGINDAPALAGADIGIAMGGGTDVAMSSAQVTLVKGDLRGIARARALSRATVANMRQNLGFAFAYNALGVPIAAGVLYPFGGPLLSPMIAALAMSLSSVSVVANALRLGRQRL